MAAVEEKVTVCLVNRRAFEKEILGSSPILQRENLWFSLVMVVGRK